MFSIGWTSILDTYISNETATGTELRYTWEKTNRKDSTRWSSYLAHAGFISIAGTRGNDNTFLGAMYNLKYGWHYNPQLPTTGLSLRVGLLADLSLGGLYNTRNSNNPAQARMSLTIDPSAMLAWHFNIKNKPFTLRYQASLPLIGIAFSPNYGQSYYEIFSRGNYDHNVVFDSPFNAVQFYQMLALDFRLWHTNFTVGYLCDIRQMKPNNLKYHQWTHAITIGWRY